MASIRENTLQSVGNRPTATVTVDHHTSFTCSRFLARGPRITRTAVARFPLRQLDFHYLSLVAVERCYANN